MCLTIDHVIRCTNLQKCRTHEHYNRSYVTLTRQGVVLPPIMLLGTRQLLLCFMYVETRESVYQRCTVQSDDYWPWPTLMSHCTGQILEEHVEEERTRGNEFGSVIYVGDGSNDLCPALRLDDNGVVFPRQNFSLDRRIRGLTTPMKARVEPWNCASQILETLKTLWWNIYLTLYGYFMHLINIPQCTSCAKDLSVLRCVGSPGSFNWAIMRRYLPPHIVHSAE